MVDLMHGQGRSSEVNTQFPVAQDTLLPLATLSLAESYKKSQVTAEINTKLGLQTAEDSSLNVENLKDANQISK